MRPGRRATTDQAAWPIKASPRRHSSYLKLYAINTELFRLASLYELKEGNIVKKQLKIIALLVTGILILTVTVTMNMMPFAQGITANSVANEITC